MEVTGIVEKPMEENESNIPDNVIYIIFPEETQQILPMNHVSLNDFEHSDISLGKNILPAKELLSHDIITVGSAVNLKDGGDNFMLNDLSCPLESMSKIDVETQTDFNSSDKIVDMAKYTEAQNGSFLCKGISSNEIEDASLCLEVEEEHEGMEQLGISSHSFFSSDKSSQISIGALDFECGNVLEDVGEKSDNSSATKELPKRAHEKQKLKKRKKTPSTTNLKCRHCLEEFSTFCSLQKHSKMVHNSDEFSFPCNLCSQSFTRPHNLLRHKETRHAVGEKKYVCEYCSRKFGRQDIYASHLRLIHGKNKSDSDDSDSVYQCSSCKKFFTKLHNYMKHQKGNLTCSKCSETFACKRSLRNHLNKRHSVTCSICGKTCPSKQQMYAHKLTHAPKFKCEYCGKGFVWESQFTVHLATHTGIRPLSCDICGNSFAHPNAVKKHKWQDHTEANKKHRCPVCGKGFVYKSKLNAHVRIHTGKKPFPCQRCSSYFSQKRNLAAHMKIVHGLIFKYLEEDDDEEEKSSESKEVTNEDDKEKEPEKDSVTEDTESREDSVTEDTESCEEQSQNFNIFPNDLIIDDSEPIYQILYPYPNEESSVSFPPSEEML